MGKEFSGSESMAGSDAEVEKSKQKKLESDARQRWGRPSPENEAFQLAVEKGYLTAEGILTEKGVQSLQGGSSPEKILSFSATASGSQVMVEGKSPKKIDSSFLGLGRERQKRGSSPAEQIIAVFTSHGVSVGKELFSLQVNDRVGNSSTTRYRLTLYSRSESSGNRPLVKIIEGTLSEIIDKVDGQAYDLFQSMTGKAARRPKIVVESVESLPGTQTDTSF